MAATMALWLILMWLNCAWFGRFKRIRVRVRYNKSGEPLFLPVTTTTTIMTSRPPHYNRYKIESEFGTDAVTHHTFKTDLRTGQRRVKVETTWVRERKLGTGTFGEVYLEQEQESGELRAVKVISRAHVKIQEVESLIDLRDVCMTSC